MQLPFHPLVNTWFAETYGKPTAVQEEAWPLIAAGKDILAIAPTGSGKTLTAFLYALSRFIDGSWDPGKLCVLYVSPLKALNEDIRRNLLEPIEALKQRTLLTQGHLHTQGPLLTQRAESDNPVFRIRVETRSGDTPQSERRRFLLHPPSILAVTPESLAILLLNPRGRETLSHIKYLVIDEIHAVMGTKRGAFLSCQIDRLKRIIGKNNTSVELQPFQRIALSATVNPPEMAAEFAGGIDSQGKKQNLFIVASPAEKQIHFSVEFPPDPGEISVEGEFRYGVRYAVLIRYIIEKIHSLTEQKKGKRPSLLVFTDSRRRAERITHLLNETSAIQNPGSGRIALCHHASLSKDVRRDVEQSLVNALVPCVVATSSLELGIDIGEIDEVILAGTPSSCSRTLQRIGRSGHSVGETSRGTLLPFHGMDLFLGAVMAGAVNDREIEIMRPIKNPLDILSQTLLALCTEDSFTPNTLYNAIRQFSVFSDLARSSFDQVIAMLTGKYFKADEKYFKTDEKFSITVNETQKEAQAKTDPARLRELKPLLLEDIDGKLYAAANVMALLYSSGGVIPSRGLYSMRLPDGTKIGELDEEFVFERRTGDSYNFGSRSWNIVEIGDEAVIVNPMSEAADFQPFWKADTAFRSPEFCERTLDFFHTYNVSKTVSTNHLISDDAVAMLEDFLLRQCAAQGAIPLPDKKTIPVEITNDPATRPDSFQIVFHSFRGAAVNYPLAMAFSALIEEKTGIRCETITDDNAVLLQLPRISSELYSGREDPALLLKDCIKPLSADGEHYFKQRLEASGIFGAAFREAAERSMILPRGTYGKRIPLWVMRQRAKRLFDKVAPLNFPAITEAWRSCLSDQFDMEGFRLLLDDIGSGETEFRFFHNTSSSPFARDLSWRETNNFMYEYDERKDILGLAGKKSLGAGKPLTSLADKAIADAVNDPYLRPTLKTATVTSFAARQRRELPGYAPEDIISLSQWVKDRVAIPLQGEWETLAAAFPPELQQAQSEDPTLGKRLCTITLPGAAVPVIAHSEIAQQLQTGVGTGADKTETLSFLSQWLQYEGPVLPSRVAEVFGCTPAEAEDAMDALAESGELVKNVKLENRDENFYCDTENYELLLRLTRKKARPELKERPASFLVPFIAMRQGLIHNTQQDAPFENLAACLSCFPAPVKLWETEIFPARDPSYKSEKIDLPIKEGSLIWFGAGNERAAFSTVDDFELADTKNIETEKQSSSRELHSLVQKSCDSYKSFWDIKDSMENQTQKTISNDELTSAVWDAVWAGEISSDTWESIRRGIEQGFSAGNREKQIENNAAVSRLSGIVPPYKSRAGNRGSRVPHALKHKWREGAPISGRWYSLANEYTDGNSAMYAQLSALEQDELNMDRVRLLLRRWGLLCRPLLEMEGCFSWSQLLPAMRRMELSGELTTGRFFGGIPSLQFASPSIIEELEALDERLNKPQLPLYWMNAADPASPAGWNIQGLTLELPARNVNTRLCFKGKDLAAVSLKNGKEAELHLDIDDPDINKIVDFFVFPRRRPYHPFKKIALETINKKPAAESPYAPCFLDHGFISDRGKLVLW